MTGEHLEAILRTASTKSDSEGWDVLPEGSQMTLYVAHDGAPLTLNRIEALRKDGTILYARGTKKEVFILDREDVFAAAIEGTVGQPARRAGFG